MKGMTVIVRTITRLVLGFILIYGAVTMFYGHLIPGGGFAAGVMLACGMILVVLAFGGDEARRILSGNLIRSWDAFGALAVFELFFMGLVGGYALSRHVPHGLPFRPVSGGTIQWSNVIVGIKVMVFLFAVFWALALFRMDNEKS